MKDVVRVVTHVKKQLFITELVKAIVIGWQISKSTATNRQRQRDDTDVSRDSWQTAAAATSTEVSREAVTRTATAARRVMFEYCVI